MNPRTGKALRRIMAGTGIASLDSLDWSPDGRLLLWSAYCCESDLFVVRSNGARPARRITSTPDAGEYGAVWSPDGRRIAFARSEWSGNEDRYGLWTMTARGTDLRRIAVTRWIDNDLTWGASPQLSWGPSRADSGRLVRH